MREYTRAIIKHNDKFLVIKEHKDSERNIWTFPGGKKDDNEDLIQSCKREVFEELGVEIENLSLLCEGIYTFPCGDWKGYYFMCTTPDISKIHIKETSKCNGFCFLPIDEIVNLPRIGIPEQVLAQL